MKKNKILYVLITAIVLLAAWFLTPQNTLFNSEKKSAEAPTTVYEQRGPQFSADSAYAFTEAQCNFGPRSMNSEGHEKCKQWIIEKFRDYGCEVMSQDASLKGYDGTMLKSSNIIARHQPELTARVLLCAHWDSRPWADNDPDSANWHKPIMAANDAASGVAVMLEIARAIEGDSALKVGIDFVCFDAEDWGTPQWEPNQTGSTDSWALGAQYFARNMPLPVKPMYGILLDMVGGIGATFCQEYFSTKYAQSVVNEVWQCAREVGQSSFFPFKEGGAITDDHVPVNEHAGIPTIDIIPYHPDCPQSSFGPTWHTVADDMSNISKNTLKAVGQTVIQMLYK